ncbi:MAG: malate dehydrogenase (oxaloacetate-decarboxylating)(NADP+) [Cognaticolwellia sp.]|jgi:malate dehydrogenase (oxaloacetate-decarboxylating)(NADP+)
MSLKDDALDYHENPRPGKLEVVPTKPMMTQRDLSLAYSPGVAAPCREIAKDPEKVFQYTAKGNLVGVVTNGTAVLGLGNIGALASKPVMEGKANLFKKFADIDVFDIELNAVTKEEVVAAVKAMAPTFGGINLEDIASPDCFYIEETLRAELDIPVFHDDQHGTAIIASAALINAMEVTGRKLEEIKVVFCGAGAAAIATARLLESLGVQNEHIWMCDSKGLVYKGRTEDMFAEKEHFAQDSELRTLADVLVGADVFVGLSVGNILTGDMLKTMADAPMVFAMANPDPEIPYEVAKAAVPNAIVATGRSDYPNQINNVLGFPGVFRGALDCRARQINEEMKMAAVRALAALAREDVPDSVRRAYENTKLTFGPDYLIPKPFDPRVLTWVAPAVAQAAADSGVARVPIQDMDAYREQLEKLLLRSREFLRPLMNRAKQRPKRVVFPDGTNTRVLRAAQQLVDEGICTPILIGEEWKVLKRAEDNNVDLTGVEIMEAGNGPIFEQLSEALYQLRMRKGVNAQRARQLCHDPTYFGCMMVREGLADGLVGGLDSPYATTLRPALQTVGLHRGAGVVSGVYAMLFKEKRIFFADCTVNESPDAKQLAQIAMNTARTAMAFGDVPRVALLSYSDFGEHRGSDQTDKVRRALALVNRVWPDLVIDGELQADTAVNPEIAKRVFPFSKIQGDANVLIFPDLTSGNMAYKLLRELGGATAVGPLLVGLSKPVNVLPVGSDVADIINITALTVNQAIGTRMKPLQGEES